MSNYAYLAENLAEDGLEGVPEVAGKQGVDKRVDGRVHVAQPKCKLTILQKGGIQNNFSVASKPV